MSLSDWDREPDPSDPQEQRSAAARRALIFGLSAVGTAVALALAFLLGALSFDARRFAAHDRRLRRMVQQEPNLEQVLKGLSDDKSPLIASPRGQADIGRVTERWGGAKRVEIYDKTSHWAQLRVFRAGDMVYFIYFDEAGVMRDFTYVSS